MVPTNLNSDLADVLQNTARRADDHSVNAALLALATIFHGDHYWLLKTGHPDSRMLSGSDAIQ